MFEVIEEQKPRAISLRPELTKMDKGQLKRSQKEAEIDHDIVRVSRRLPNPKR